MAIIYTYGFDNNVQDNDAWIGTNATNRKTKQFTVASVANYLNSAGRIAVGGQMTFKFVTSGASNGTISIPGGGGAGTNFTDIASLYVSIVDTSGANVTEWLDYLVGQELLLSEQNEPNNFGHYRITSYTVDTNPNFYTLVLTDIGGYGVITADTYYNLNNVNLISGNVDPTGLEAINEGNGIGWRLIGRDADNYGNIGLNAVDFSNSDSISTERGSTGNMAVTFGYNNINQQTGSIVIGQNVSAKITDIYQGSNIIAGYDSFVWGAAYSSFIGVNRSTIGVEGTNYTTNALYQNLIIGDGLNYYAGRDSGAVGGGLISGSTACFTVGMANEDLTTTTSNWITAQYNNYGPRFIVGVGTYTPTTGVAGVRQNGFVVMSDGTATFPVLTNAMIDAADDDSAVTKGYVNAQASAAQANFVFYDVKNSSGAQILKGKAVMAVGTDGNSGHILIDEMIADGSIEPKYFMGVLETTLDNGEIGRVIHFGELDQFNTNGQNGEVWSDGDVLWCDPANPGDFTIVEPDGPNLKIASAIVINKATNGKIKVRVQGNEGIHELHDTRITTQADGELLVWNNTDGVWFNDGTATIDYTNSRVGIGTTSPGVKLDVQGTVLVNNEIRFVDSSMRMFRSSDDMRFRTGNSDRMTIDSLGNVGIGTTSPAYKLDVNGDIRASTNITGNNIYANTSLITSYIYNGAATSLRLYNANAQPITFSTLASERMRITDTGDVGIGLTSPATKLDVKGPTSGYIARFRGTNNLSIYDAGGSAIGVGAEAGSQLKLFSNNSFNNGITVDTNGNIGIGESSPAHRVTSKVAADNNYAFYAVNTAGGNRGGIYITSAGDTQFVGRTGAGQTVAINANASSYLNGGNVGIGTTSPTDLLHLEGASTPTLKIVDTTNTTITELYSNDFDTYLANESSGRVFIRTGGSNGFVVDSAGDVGIGTTNPIYKLDIQAESPAIRIQDISDANSFLVGADNSGGYLGMFTTDSLRIYTNSLERMRIDSSGRVGIGTTNPSAALDIVGGDVEIESGRLIKNDNFFNSINLYRGSDASMIFKQGHPTVGRIQFLNNSNTEVVTFDVRNEKVGIGTTSPSHKLHVQGTGGALLVTRDVGTASRIGIGTSNPSTALQFGAYSDGIITGVTQLRYSGARIIQNGGSRLVFQSDQGHYFYPVGINPGGDIFGVVIRHLRDSATYTNDNILLVEKSDTTSLFNIKSNGNVGIGTTSPSEKLHVVGDSLANNYWAPSGSNAYYMNYNSTAGMYVDSTGFITLNAGGNEGIRIESTFGNVGIGTTSPTEKLDVSGNIHASGKILVDGGIESGTSIKVSNDTASANAGNVGSIRYRTDTNNSYAEMSMQTGASTYAWVVIQQNTW